MSIEVEIKAALDAQGKAWEEFKTANDARIAAIEGKGYAPADLTEKVGVINTDLTKLSKDVEEWMKKANRIPAGEQKSQDEMEHKNAFNAFLRKGHDGGLAEIQKKAMRGSSDPDGGYLILPEMDKEIDRVVPVVSAMARIAKTVTIGSSKYKKLVKTAGMAMRRVGDGQTGGETTEPVYKSMEIEVFTAEVEPWVYNETLEDSFVNLESDLTEEAAIGFAEGAAAEFITGDGVGKARGFATGYTAVANASFAWGKVGYIASGKSAAFASVAPSDALITLQHALKQQHRPGAVFLMADATLATARQMKDASGSYYLWNPDPLAGFGGRFLGSPVEVDDNMPVIAANSYSVAYGNFARAYTIVNRAGTTVIRDNLTAKGKTKFNFRRRFGGGIVNFEAVKLMRFATS